MNKNNIYWLVLSTTSFFIHAEMGYYSQHKQDKYVYETFFMNKKNGVFVDIGATDGIGFSNTYFFEKYLGWTGICFEPRKTEFDRLIKNRNCICLNVGIAEFNGVIPFLELTGYTSMLSGVLANYDAQHLARIDHELSVYGGTKEIINIPVRVLEDVLKEHNINHIDYLSIDTEGNELSILKSINFDAVSIDIIDVENNYNDPAFEEYLKKYNYKLITRIECDEIYQKQY